MLPPLADAQHEKLGLGRGATPRILFRMLVYPELI
jgi:hypothetical protein